MTVALKGWIFNLRFEFIADAPIFLFFLTAAGTKSAVAPESVPAAVLTTLLSGFSVIFNPLSSEQSVDIAANHSFIHGPDACCIDISVCIYKGGLRNRRNIVGVSTVVFGIKIHRESITVL